MPKSKNKIVCKICSREISASAFCRHCRSFESHNVIMDEALDYTKEVFAEINKRVCSGCGVELKFDEKLILNQCVLVLSGVPIKRKEWEKRFCSSECCLVSKAPWNKGLTQNEHPSLKAIADGRRGDNNPIFAILRDPEKKAEWVKKIHEASRLAFIKRGVRTLEEMHGTERAEEIRNKQRVHAFGNSWHLGKTHTEETKDILRRKCCEQWSSNKQKVSKPQQKFFECLKNNIHEEIVLEYGLEWYSLDIAFPQYKICVEVDGDFFHCNQERGFCCKSEIQKRNLMNDKRKEQFLLEKEWDLIRIWESDINEREEECLDKVKSVLSRKKSSA